MGKTTLSYYSYRIFHFLLLAFIAFHMAISSPDWSTIDGGFLSPSNEFFLLANILVLILLVISLLKPNNILLFMLTLSFLAAVKIDALPRIPNHMILALIVFFTFFCSLPFYYDKSLSVQRRLGNWYEKVAPFLRVELLIMYFFVVLDKANYSFFNPEVSCGAQFYADIAHIYPIFPNFGAWTQWLSILGSFGFELFIPVLLFFSPTRTFGVFTGLIFHFLLSFHPNLYILSYSAELYALYVLFLPEELIEKIWNRTIELLQWPVLQKLISYLGAFLLLSILIYILTGIAAFEEKLQNVFSLVKTAWLLWALGLIFGFVIVAYPSFFKRTASGIFNMKWNLLLIFPFLVFLNGITPYIGLKTSTNFAMFSNLKVDGAVNNHWFMPSNYQVADFQNDTVTLISASHPFLKTIIKRNERLTYFQLKKFLYKHKYEDIRLTYKRKGKLYSLDLPADLAKNGITAPSWLASKLLIFKTIPIAGPTPCQW